AHRHLHSFPTRRSSDLTLPHLLDGEVEDLGVEPWPADHSWIIRRSARRWPAERRHQRVAADQRYAARDVVESAAADASRPGRLGRNHAQADDVHGDGERAVAAGPGRLGPLQRDIEVQRLTAQPEADAPTGRLRNE